MLKDYFNTVWLNGLAIKAFCTGFIATGIAFITTSFIIREAITKSSKKFETE